MSRIIIFAFLIFAGWYFWQYLKSLPPAQRGKIIRSWGFGALLIISLLLVATGRMHWIGAAIAAILPLVKIFASTAYRALPILQLWQRHQGKPSVIKTRGLQVTINFANGQMDGLVLEGPYKDRELRSLDESNLKEQLLFFKEQDRQAYYLLQAYLLRQGHGGFTQEADQPPSSAQMTRDEALQILGLEESATTDDIIKAHRRLIQKLHPDKGGNDFLAAKVNLAKITLLP